MENCQEEKHSNSVIVADTCPVRISPCSSVIFPSDNSSFICSPNVANLLHVLMSLFGLSSISFYAASFKGPFKLFVTPVGILKLSMISFIFSIPADKLRIVQLNC